MGRGQYDDLQRRHVHLENVVMTNLPRFATLEARMAETDRRLAALEMQTIMSTENNAAENVRAASTVDLAASAPVWREDSPPPAPARAPATAPPSHRGPGCFGALQQALTRPSPTNSVVIEAPVVEPAPRHVETASRTPDSARSGQENPFSMPPLTQGQFTPGDVSISRMNLLETMVGSQQHLT